MISRATAVQKDVSVPTAVEQSLEGTVKAMRIVGSMAVPAVVLKCRMLPMTWPKDRSAWPSRLLLTPKRTANAT